MIVGSTNTDNRINYGPALENAVYVYARTHGYSASIGRIGSLECDFILRRGAADYAYAHQSKWRIHMIDTADRKTPTDVIAVLPGSRRYAERDFLKATGKTILQVIIDVRLEKVKELLQNPKCRLSTIASQCGWTSANYLRRAFQDRMHMSMSDWRKQNVRG